MLDAHENWLLKWRLVGMCNHLPRLDFYPELLYMFPSFILKSLESFPFCPQQLGLAKKTNTCLTPALMSMGMSVESKKKIVIELRVHKHKRGWIVLANFHDFLEKVLRTILTGFAMNPEMRCSGYKQKKVEWTRYCYVETPLAQLRWKTTIYLCRIFTHFTNWAKYVQSNTPCYNLQHT